MAVIFWAIVSIDNQLIYMTGNRGRVLILEFLKPPLHIAQDLVQYLLSSRLE